MLLLNLECVHISLTHYVFSFRFQYIKKTLKEIDRIISTVRIVSFAGRRTVPCFLLIVLNRPLLTLSFYQQ